MRAPAQFLAEFPDPHHSHPFPVLVAEKRQGSGVNGFLDTHNVGLDERVAQHVKIDHGFDFFKVPGAERLEMGKIKTQPVRGNQRTILFHLGAQNFSKRRVKEMCGGMIPGRAVPGRRVHRRGQRLALTDAPGHDRSLVKQEFSAHLGGFPDLNSALRTRQRTLIANLPASFRIEGGGIQDQFHVIPFHDFFRQNLSFAHDLHHALGLKRLVPEELRRRKLVCQFGDEWLLLFRDEDRRFPCPVTLRFQRTLKAFKIGDQAVFTSSLFDQIQWKAIRIVQFENALAIQSPGSGFTDHAVQDGQTLIQRADKPFLLTFDDCATRLSRTGQFGIRSLHLSRHRAGQFMQKRFGHAQEPSMSGRPA